MDDSYFICPTYDDAVNTLNEYIEIFKGFSIVVNPKKTKITHISKPLIFSKWKYQLLPNGKVVNIPAKKTVYRQRRKLRKMFNNNINIEEIKTSIVSFGAYLNLGNCYKYINYLKDNFMSKICQDDSE